MHKVKQDFFHEILKQNVSTFSTYAEYEVVAALRHLPLYYVILFPAALLRLLKGKKSLFIG